MSSALDSQPPDLPARVGRYHVVRSIGRGAMGRVLLAEDPVLERQVAIKFLRRDLRLTEDERDTLSRRIRQEARASARVSHPHLVALFDMGEQPDVGVYLVFEHAEGLTLKARLQRGPLSNESAARLALELGDGLTTAHRAGVLHRDIKPDNIILTSTGARIADFGIARVPESTLTKGGGLLGTPAYSAPECITEGAHSPASDQFSLAATLYEAISGERAFPGDDAVGVATRIQTDDPPPIAASLGIDPAVDRVLARALAKRPEQRFGSCAEFGHTLAEVLSPAGIAGVRGPLNTVPDRHHREQGSAALRAGRTARLALGGAVLGAVLVLIAGRLVRELDASGTAGTPGQQLEPSRPAWFTLPVDAGARTSPHRPAPPRAAGRTPPPSAAPVSTPDPTARPAPLSSGQPSASSSAPQPPAPPEAPR